MNAEQSACASSSQTEAWEQIDWSLCERRVRRLQARIVKATREGRHGKAKALQWLLTHSFTAKALAVKRVTENQGKNTPGVDLGRYGATGSQIQSHQIATASRIQTAALEAGLYTEGQWEVATAGHSDDERPRHASVTPAGVGTRRRNHCGQKLPRLPSRTLHRRRH